jgi:amino acid transporter
LAVGGIKESSQANILFTCVEIAGLVLVIVAGFTHEGAVAPISVSANISPSVVGAAAILFFVYLGFEELANVAEEARNPGRDIPRAIFWGLAVTTVLYVLVSLAILKLSSPQELAASEAPLSLAMQNAWPRAGTWLSAIALFATANTVLITLVAAARLSFSMGRDGELPAIFGRVLPRQGTPWISSVLVLVLASALLPIGDLAILAGLSSFSALLAFLAVNLALIALRYTQPDRPRPFRVPFAIGRMPLPPIAAIAFILLLLGYFEGKVYQGGAVALALAALIFMSRRWWRGDVAVSAED